MTGFYTGLSTWAVFLHVLLSCTLLTPSSRLCLEDELFMVLVRLRLGIFLQVIAIRFRVSPSIVSRIFQKWLDVMSPLLSFLISSPAREICQHNKKICFLCSSNSIRTVAASLTALKFLSRHRRVMMLV